MDAISKQILTALAKDEGDGFVCIEIIEPYVNTNRNVEATYLDIFEKLLSLSQDSFIENFELVEKDSQEVYIVAELRKENFKRLWFKINDKGKEKLSSI